jgi:peptide/nickel transport system ATP-binding protein
MGIPIIKTEKLSKYFKTPRGILHAVEQISLGIEEKETLGVVGESGCGKSTLGRTILGLTSATSGSVFFQGNNITYTKGSKRRELRKNMQIIFQDPFSSLDPRMNVRDLIAEPLLTLHAVKSKKEAYERVRTLMEMVSLASRFEQSYPHELDGGRRQRIGVARALAINPKFIVCDEPVSALDMSVQAQILNLIQDLQEQLGLTYMFITHDLSVVKHISNHIMVMYLGLQVEKAESKELFLNPLHPYTKGLLSAIPIPSIHVVSRHMMLQGELTSPINPTPGCRFAARCPWAKDICKENLPALEEVLSGHFCACHYVREIDQ